MKAKQLIAYCALLLLSSCGFHLRGTLDMPPWLNNVAIVMHNGHHDLAGLLKSQLQAYHINIVSDPSRASYVLIIENDDLQQQITSVSASTTPRQYQLIYTVRFNLISHNGKVVMPTTPIAVSRQLTVNNDRILGSDAEEATINSEMRRDAVIQIINRLNRAM